MENTFGREKIGMNTYFAYIYVSMGPLYDVSLHVHSNHFKVIAANLLKNYLFCLMDDVCESGWTEEVDTENVREIIAYLDDNGHGDKLREVVPLLSLAGDDLTPEEVRQLAETLRPIVEELGGAMDFSLCANLVEYLQFLRQFEEDVTIGELFDEYLDGAELDCDEIR